jgi:hypothetical protein
MQRQIQRCRMERSRLWRAATSLLLAVVYWRDEIQTFDALADRFLNGKTITQGSFPAKTADISDAVLDGSA